jgi:hypothetical protein
MVAGLKSLSIFHQPSFPDKIRGIQDRNHLIALFAAMFSLSSRLATDDETTHDGTAGRASRQEFHDLSLQYIHTSLEDCSNSPPLCLLQAITLAGYYKLVNGVYGPAWRLVGTGVRIAYELRLHLIDCKGYSRAPLSDSELMAWSRDEERRRCWWALWEMDIFSSTIQRAPTAIDWSANETFLPITDEHWFTNTYQASCLLHGGPEERLERLKTSGNENSVAWCNLMASLMHDGRLLCQESIKGITTNTDHHDDIPKLTQYYNQVQSRKTQEFSDRLSSLVRTYQAATEHAPTALSYHDEVLSFDLTEGEDPFSTRRISTAKYSFHMMSASACFMIYQNYVFTDILEGQIPLSTDKVGHGPPEQDSSLREESMFRKCLKNYLEASNMVLQLLDHCPEDHVRYVNPYYASTIWIAAALQVFKRFALRDNISVIAQRQYDLLRRFYLQFSHFWETPLALLQNLDSLEARLESRQRELELSENQAKVADTISQQSRGRTQPPVETEPLTSLTSQDRLFPDWPSPRSAQWNLTQCSPRDRNPSDPELPAEDVAWISGMTPEFDPSTARGAFPEPWVNTWPDASFMGDLAYYSSDVMAHLFHGYTT